MKSLRLRLRVAVLGAALGLAASGAGASATVVQINDGATPGDFVFGVAAIGWKWTAPTSFVWDGLGSTFKTCCQFNVLSPSQATLLIATDTPANGGTTLYAGAVDGAGHASFAGIAVTAGTSYFIGYGNLMSSAPFAVGLNIVNWVPDQPLGTVNLSGWYTGSNFASFIPASVVGGVQQQPFSAPILRFEGVAAAVPEPTASLLMASGVAALLAGLRRRRAAG